METIRINILNPKVKQLLKDLADMNLINIQKDTSRTFVALLKKLRSKVGSTPSLEEITSEVEAVRSRRYGK